MTAATNPQITDVLGIFNALDDQGAAVEIHKGCLRAPGISVHFQGIVEYRDHLILSYNNPGMGNNAGVLVIARLSDRKVIECVEIPDEHHRNHPGGMQVIGDYLVVGVETGGKPRNSVVYFYDLTGLANGHSPKLVPELTITRKDKGTGAVGITDWVDNHETRYVIAAFDNGDCDFYTADSDFFKNGKVSLAFNYHFEESGYSSLNFVTDTNQRKWMLGFYRRPPYQDYVDLWRVSVDTHTLDMVASKHFFFNGPPGLRGFRFAGGLHISQSADNYEVLSSTRNPSILHHFTVDTWSVPDDS